MYDYYLGSRTHFAAAREAAEKVLAVLADEVPAAQQPEPAAARRSE